jgi:class 3 adenylate cyclase/F0F1-type ATP synthase delta subunit
MFKLSKESQITFFSLLIIPVVWASLNYFGFLDYLKTKSLDWRMQFRGEIAQSTFDLNESIIVEGNVSIPKIPKLTYVNFDASTLAMDDVGERPWDRAFFRDMAMALIERGNARVLAFDFGFTPKSMSKMVPAQNSYRSDAAMGELISKYSEKVVLGCLYSGVPTPFVKGVNSSAFPPLFKDGYSFESSVQSGKFNYPESPTYPLINFRNGEHLGRLGSFTVPPYRAVDEIPRWVPLWFPSGGKSHAYNLLGGKKSKLLFELPRENADKIDVIVNQIEELKSKKQTQQVVLAKNLEAFTTLAGKKTETEAELAAIAAEKDKIAELKIALGNFNKTLEANPALSAIIGPQIKTKESEISSLLRSYLPASESNKSSLVNIAELNSEQRELNETVQNLNVALKANPALVAVIKPQVNQKNERLKEIRQLLDEHNQLTPLTPALKERARVEMIERISELNSSLEKFLPTLSSAGSKLAVTRNQIDGIDASLEEADKRLSQLRGEYPTELVEHNNSLMLVYSGGKNVLVDSEPNKVPLIHDKKFFTLGLEALLSYYGLQEDAVTISEDLKNIKITDKNGDGIIECKMSEGQFVEVNWFSQWTELVEEEELLRDAKKFYGDEEYQQYTNLIKPIFEALLIRAGVDVTDKSIDGMIKAVKTLGLEPEKFQLSQKLLNAKHSDEDLPSFQQLSDVAASISYYFISPRLESEYNPMCGMGDVIENARFQDQVRTSIVKLEEKIASLEGPGFMGKIISALEANPENESLLAKKEQVLSALQANKDNLAQQHQELSRINDFFASFANSIVLIGPEEKTFQDLAPTPFDKASVPKVSVHGNLIKTLTTGKYLKRLPDSFDYAATFIVCILLAGLAVYQGNRASLIQACGFLLVIGYVMFGFITFSESHVIWPITTPVCAGLSTSFVGLAVMVVIEQKAKGKLKGMFGSYVSSDLVEQMVESGEEPKLGGEETGITAFFSDVQAFSSFSELLTPTGLVDLMNEYLTAMTNILQEERGTLDKYIGDAIVAMYGAPIPMDDHAYQSVRTAILMQQKQIELREKWVPEVEKWGQCHGLVTQMQTRIGCNTGTATVGNMGALDRFNYTMMGDMVNLAARCESGAKAYGAYIMVTEETKLASEATKDDIAFRYLDKIVVKGRSQPVAMYEPTGFMNELSQETQDCLDCFRQGISKYLKQDWGGALNLFEKAKELEPNRPGVTPGVKDNPSMILIDRCKIMQENPPGDDWDGVYVMTTK